MNNQHKIATIVPYNNLDSIRFDKYFMALAHIAKQHENYVKFFRDRVTEGSYVMLDNSAVEVGSPGNFEEYFEIAKEMRASMIMLPDHFKNADHTLAEANQVMFKYGGALQKSDLDVMVIPQGLSMTEWKHNMEDLYQVVARYLPRSAVIGISCRYTDFFGGSRALGVLLARELLYKARIHLLGAYADPTVEIQPLLGFDFIRGVDSSYPSIYTSHNRELKSIDFANPRPERNIDFINDTLSHELLGKNINAWKEACSQS